MAPPRWGASASRSARYAQPPDVVWRAITDYDEFPAWRSNVDFMSRFVFGYTATIETYLVDLGRKFGEETTPRSAAE